MRTDPRKNAAHFHDLGLHDKLIARANFIFKQGVRRQIAQDDLVVLTGLRPASRFQSRALRFFKDRSHFAPFHSVAVNAFFLAFVFNIQRSHRYRKRKFHSLYFFQFKKVSFFKFLAADQSGKRIGFLAGKNDYQIRTEHLQGVAHGILKPASQRKYNNDKHYADYDSENRQPASDRPVSYAFQHQ